MAPWQQASWASCGMSSRESLFPTPEAVSCLLLEGEKPKQAAVKEPKTQGFVKRKRDCLFIHPQNHQSIGCCNTRFRHLQLLGYWNNKYPPLEQEGSWGRAKQPSYWSRSVLSNTCPLLHFRESPCRKQVRKDTGFCHLRTTEKSQGSSRPPLAQG